MSNLATFVSLSDIGIDPETGIGSISRRGLAKLCGVHSGTWGKGAAVFTPKIDEYLAQRGFEGAACLDESNRVIDLVAALVVKFYAYKGREQAQRVDEALSAIGMRVAIQQATGWRRVRPTREEIIDICCLPVASSWERRFPEEYYDELSRLTGLEAQGHKRPSLWAELTREFVYNHLPSGVYNEIKQAREQSGGFDKLHQFLSEDGVAILEHHQRTLLTLMQSAATLNDLRVLLQQVKHREYQLRLV